MRRGIYSERQSADYHQGLRHVCSEIAHKPVHKIDTVWRGMTRADNRHYLPPVHIGRTDGEKHQWSIIGIGKSRWITVVGKI